MKAKTALLAVLVGLCLGARADDYTLKPGENELTAAMNAKGNRLIAVVDVRMVKRHAGAYLLASGVAEGSTVTLGSVEGIEAARVRVRVTDTSVYADVEPIGMMLIVR